MGSDEPISALGTGNGTNVMRFEERRLSTFQDWPPNAKVDARKIARAGFHHTGEETRVKCSWCGCVLSHWDYGDQVMARHRTANPGCPFILNQSNNVPLGNISEESQDEMDQSPGGGVESQPESQPDQSQSQQQSEESLTSEAQPSQNTPDTVNLDVSGGPGSLEARLDEVISIERMNAADDMLEEEDDNLEDEDAATPVIDMVSFEGSSRLSSQFDPSLAQGEDVVSFPPQLNRSESSSSASAIDNSEFKREDVRLRTFRQWPSRFGFMSPGDMAKAGFVYTGRNDCVRCVFCGEYVGSWCEGDEPMTEHRAIFPHCPFIRDPVAVGNVPSTLSIHAEAADEPAVNYRTSTTSLDVGPGGASSRLSPSSGGEAGSLSADETGIRPRPRDLHSGPEKATPILNLTSRDSTGEKSGIIRHSGPANLKYTTVEARLRTFRDWPPALKQQPQELSDAGFYYIGLSDQVKCFYCDGGLRNWQPEDDPWTEHSRWFSKCGFVRLVKGDDFIKECIESKPTSDASTTTSSSQTTSSQASTTMSDDRVQQAMRSSVVQGALSLGIDPSRVKMALRSRMSELSRAGRDASAPFRSVNELVDYAFGVHRDQEDRHNVETNVSESPFTSTSSRGAGAQASAEVMPSTSTSGMYLVEDGATSTSAVTSAVTSATEESASESQDEVNTTRPIQHTEPVSTPHDPTASPTPLRSSTSVPESALGGGPGSLRVASPEGAAAATNSKTMTSSRSEAQDLAEMTKSKSMGDALVGADELEQENRRLKEQRICKICMDQDIGVVFLPCGHLICCVQCAPALKDCPLCRQTIHGTVKTYMS